MDKQDKQDYAEGISLPGSSILRLSAHASGWALPQLTTPTLRGTEDKLVNLLRALALGNHGEYRPRDMSDKQHFPDWI